jgi:hypothetical protein
MRPSQVWCASGPTHSSSALIPFLTPGVPNWSTWRRATRSPRHMGCVSRSAAAPGARWCAIVLGSSTGVRQRRPTSIQNDSGLSQGRKGHLRAHSVRQSAHALQIDAPGPKGERSWCTPIRQAPGGWQCRASASRKISWLVRVRSIRRNFGIGRSRNAARRTANMMLRLNGLTASLRVHHCGHGFRPDGEMVAVETTGRSSWMRYH